MKVVAFISCILSGFLLCAWFTAIGAVPVGHANVGGLVSCAVITGLSAFAVYKC